MDTRTALCYRCEKRARYLEDGHAPRCECADVNRAVYCCYAYRPVKPVVLARAPGYEDRPRFSPGMICARERAVRVYDGEYAVADVKDGSVIYVLPPSKEPDDGAQNP